jgi:hypothetical protein
VLVLAVTIAMTPSPIAVLFSPHTRHLSELPEGLQDADLSAFAATGPAVTAIEVKSAGSYTRSNCRLAGWPPVAVPERERFNGTVEPGGPDPESRTRVVLWQIPIDVRNKLRTMARTGRIGGRFLRINQDVVDTHLTCDSKSTSSTEQW